MKKIVFILLTSILSSALFAQLDKKEEKQIDKELKSKAIKQARKEAKRLKKDGWTVNPGSLPLDKTLENAWKKQSMTDENSDPIYITADGDAVAETQTAAEMQAIEMAKLQLAGLVQTNINSLISSNIGNAQLNTEEASSVTEIVQSSKNLITMELGYVDPFFKIYRDMKDKKVQVKVRLFYDRTQSLDIAKKVVRKEIKDKLKLNEKKLEKLMGIDE
jgi:hypothetical protein